MKALVLALAMVLGAGSAVASDNDSLPNYAPVLRKAVVKGSIQKNFVERTENSVRVKSELVCEFEGELKVFNARENGMLRLDTFAKCDSTANGKPVAVKMWGYMSEGFVSIGGVKSDAKFASAALVVGDTVQKQLSANAGTRDLREDSILLYLQPTFFSGKDLPAKEEVFSATIEFVDAQ